MRSASLGASSPSSSKPAPRAASQGEPAITGGSRPPLSASRNGTLHGRTARWAPRHRTAARGTAGRARMRSRLPATLAGCMSGCGAEPHGQRSFLATGVAEVDNASPEAIPPTAARVTVDAPLVALGHGRSGSHNRATGRTGGCRPADVRNSQKCETRTSASFGAALLTAARVQIPAHLHAGKWMR
jgi:hypothetical protein